MREKLKAALSNSVIEAIGIGEDFPDFRDDLLDLAEALEKLSSVLLESECADCNFITGTRYEFKPANEALAKLYSKYGVAK